MEIDRSDIAEIIEEQHGIPAEQTVNVLKALSEVLPGQLAEYGRVELFHFGSFHLDERKARTGRNFETGEPVMIPFRLKVVFNASHHFAKAIEDITDTPTY